MRTRLRIQLDLDNDAFQTDMRAEISMALYDIAHRLELRQHVDENGFVVGSDPVLLRDSNGNSVGVACIEQVGDFE